MANADAAATANANANATADNEFEGKDGIGSMLVEKGLWGAFRWS